MKSIVFQSNQLSVRGTEIALFDYASYNQSILGNFSVIAYQKNHPLNDQGVIDKFSQKFQMMPYDDMSSLDRQIESNQSSLLYSIKAGQPDAVISKVVPTMVHAVFPQDISNVHGASYAFVSEWLSVICSHHVIPSVPHIVTLPEIQEDIRAELGIAKNATVFGCYGGADSFDIDFAKKVVADVLDIRPDIFFIFMNINAFIAHHRAIFLPNSSSLEFKVKFINSCDAMLHARKLGESFGLACAEFSIRNKPIFTYSKSLQRHHLDVLGDKAFLYASYRRLRKSILDFDRVFSANKAWDCYSEKFSPNKIMALFDKHLIQEAERNGLFQSPSFEFSLQDRFFCKYQELKLKSIKLSRLWAS